MGIGQNLERLETRCFSSSLIIRRPWKISLPGGWSGLRGPARCSQPPLPAWQESSHCGVRGCGCHSAKCTPYPVLVLCTPYPAQIPTHASSSLLSPSPPPWHCNPQCTANMMLSLKDHAGVHRLGSLHHTSGQPSRSIAQRDTGVPDHTASMLSSPPNASYQNPHMVIIDVIRHNHCYSVQPFEATLVHRHVVFLRVLLDNLLEFLHLALGFRRDLFVDVRKHIPQRWFLHLFCG